MINYSQNRDNVCTALKELRRSRVLMSQVVRRRRRAVGVILPLMSLLESLRHLGLRYSLQQTLQTKKI